MWEFGRTDYHDLYMGHTIFNEEQVIEQYGKSTTVRFQRLDHLVSHGIRSWIFDDLYFVGGYAQYDRIVEFRPFRVKLLMSLARKITDQEARERYADQVERDRKQDEKAAKEDPHAYLPGLNSRLVQRSLESLWHDVQQPGMTESQHQLSFLAELDDVWFEGPTLAHEGRHVIDFHRGSTNPVGLEFNAKLAETAFCRYPGIPLGYNILHPYGIGGHSEANKQIVAGYVSWMEEYASDINGLDLSKPITLRVGPKTFNVLTFKRLTLFIHHMHGLAERTFNRFLQRLRHCRVRVNRQRHVFQERPHLEGESRLADELADPAANGDDAQQLLGVTVGNRFDETVGRVKGHRPTGRFEGE